MLITSC